MLCADVDSHNTTRATSEGINIRTGHNSKFPNCNYCSEEGNYLVNFLCISGASGREFEISLRVRFDNP